MVILYINHYDYVYLEACTCTAAASTNFLTFDKQWINFEGNCKYTMADSRYTKCPFTVEMQTAMKNDKTQIRFVSLTILGTKISIHRGKYIWVFVLLNNSHIFVCVTNNLNNSYDISDLV